jgi:hypothetical protein
MRLRGYGPIKRQEKLPPATRRCKARTITRSIYGRRIRTSVPSVDTFDLLEFTHIFGKEKTTLEIKRYTLANFVYNERSGRQL